MKENIKTQSLYIEDMTCANCENAIEQGLSNVEGIENVKASYSAGTVIITYDSEIINLAQIEKLIEELHYHVKNSKNMKTGQKASNGQDFSNIIGVGIIIFASYLILNRFGFLNIFNSFPVAKAGMGYGMLFIIGLLTSVHCIAMCGGICLSQSVPKKAENENIKSRFAALRPSLLYNLGRVLSYTIIGGIVGAIGSVVSFSGTAKGFVQIFAGVFMVIMGINMLNIFPWLKKFNLRMPKIFARTIYAKRFSSSPFFIGLLNGLMPCGPLQAMQLYALSTGSPVKGALSMLVFSVGTVPLMFTFGAISTFLNKKFTSKMMTVSAVLVVLLGIFMFNNGVTLSGFILPSVAGAEKPAAQASDNVAVIKDGVQTVTTTLSSGQYEPIIVQKGIPVKWTIKAPAGSINGCNGSILIQKFNIQKDLTQGDNVIEFTPTQSGTIPYSCWMGMIRSKITVVDDSSNISSADNADVSGGSDSSSITIPTDKLAVAQIKDGIQYVNIKYDDTGFSPAVVVVQKGIKTKWIIEASKLDSTNKTIAFPNYSDQIPLSEGENPINFTPEEDFDFNTADNAYFGYVKVVDDINKIDKSAIKKEIQNYHPVIQSSGGCCAGMGNTGY
jgi:Uncharacterized conserved protein